MSVEAVLHSVIKLMPPTSPIYRAQITGSDPILTVGGGTVNVGPLGTCDTSMTSRDALLQY